MNLRVCKKCNEQKILEDFSKSPVCKEGRRYTCKLCMNKEKYKRKGPCKDHPSWFKKGHKYFAGSEKGWFTSERLKGNNYGFKKGQKPHNFIEGKGLQRGAELRKRFSIHRMKKVRLEVIERDKFKCVRCEQHSEILHVHHKIPLRVAPSKAYDMENLTTCCPKCHKVMEKEYKVKNANK